MEPQPALQSIHLFSPEPLRAANSCLQAYGINIDAIGGGSACLGPGHRVAISEGPANQLKYAHSALRNSGAWDAFGACTKGLPPSWRKAILRS
jgi:hypothetical protein